MISTGGIGCGYWKSKKKKWSGHRHSDKLFRCCQVWVLYGMKPFWGWDTQSIQRVPLRFSCRTEAFYFFVGWCDYGKKLSLLQNPYIPNHFGPSFQLFNAAFFGEHLLLVFGEHLMLDSAAWVRCCVLMKSEQGLQRVSFLWILSILWINITSSPSELATTMRKHWLSSNVETINHWRSRAPCTRVLWEGDRRT